MTTTMSVEQRDALAQQMLPVAAHLAVLVHGDGGPEDVAQVLAGLDDTQKNALIVVLAALVDPDQPVGKALSWTDVTRHGALPVPSWLEQRPVREHAPEPAAELDDDYVDPVAVERFVQGLPVKVTDSEFLAAVQECVKRGMSMSDINQMHRWPPRFAENWVNRLRKRYQRAGREFPSLAQPNTRTFTEAEVVAIRKKAAAGVPEREIAMSCGASRETIRAICRGQRYAQYGGPIRGPRSSQPSKASREYMCGHADNSQAAQSKVNGFQVRNAVLTPQDRDAIRQRTRAGENAKQLAIEYGVSVQTIRAYAA